MGTYICICLLQRLKNIGLVTGPGGLFTTRFATESGGLATNPPCDKRVKDYSTLHRGPRPKFVTEEGGPRQSLFRGTAIYVYVHLDVHVYVYVTTHIICVCICICFFAYVYVLVYDYVYHMLMHLHMR